MILPLLITLSGLWNIMLQVNEYKLYADSFHSKTDWWFSLCSFCNFPLLPLEGGGWLFFSSSCITRSHKLHLKTILTKTTWFQSDRLISPVSSCWAWSEDRTSCLSLADPSGPSRVPVLVEPRKWRPALCFHWLPQFLFPVSIVHDQQEGWVVTEPSQVASFCLRCRSETKCSDPNSAEENWKSTQNVKSCQQENLCRVFVSPRRSSNRKTKTRFPVLQLK